MEGKKRGHVASAGQSAQEEQVSSGREETITHTRLGVYQKMMHRNGRLECKINFREFHADMLLTSQNAHSVGT